MNTRANKAILYLVSVRSNSMTHYKCPAGYECATPDIADTRDSHVYKPSQTASLYPALLSFHHQHLVTMAARLRLEL